MAHRSMEWSWLLAFALAGGSSLPAHAQATPAPGCRPPALLKDVSPGGDGSSPGSFVRIGSTVYFSASGAIAGDPRDRELWKSDGTEAGTVRVRDINPGGESIPEMLTELNGMLLFKADDGGFGIELWKSDGTEAGTVKVREIGEGMESGGTTDMVTMGGKAYLTAANHVEGRELWVSDGTFEGTRLIKDINPGIRPSITPGTLRVAGSTLYFAADDNVRGAELWKSDGTSEGTQLVKEVNPGAGGASIGELAVVGTTVFFTANNGTTDNELWKSDGTEAGTVRVKDIFGKPFHPAPESLAAAGGKLFFRLDDEVSGAELWKSDGTEAGTVRVKDIRGGAEGSFPGDFTHVGGTLYFTADDGVSGVELWKSDGTEAGTVRVKDIRAGSTGSSPQQLTAGGSLLLFVADDGSGPTLWLSDGTEAGTRAVDAGAVKNPEALAFTGDAAYFSAEDGSKGRELYSVSTAFFGDCTPPDLTCPADVEATATSNAGAVVNYSPAQGTDSGSAVTLSYSMPSGSTFPVGNNRVEVTAADASGNRMSCSFSVAVKAADGGGEPDSGCGCTSGFTADAAWLLLGTLAPLLARRRRSSP